MILPVDAGAPVAEVVALPAAGPRRSILAQDRSRRTRGALVDAAFALWSERGFETGIETTTVEEIARAAGVTKGTFYFHFARKVDVLLEVNTASDDAMVTELHAALDDGTSVDVAVQRALAAMADMTERLPRSALSQILREYHRSPGLAREQSAFRRMLPNVFADAQARGELPDDVDAEQLASLVAAIILSAAEAWADGRSAHLAPDLQYGVRVLFGGIRAEHARSVQETQEGLTNGRAPRQGRRRS